jgi:molecular chaperone GrpE
MSDSVTDPVADARDAEPVDGELLADDVAAAEAAVVSDLDQLQAERDELRTVAQRLQADFENYKKRMLREQTSAIERANERLLESLLPALDSFELAQRSLESLEGAGAPSGFVAGNGDSSDTRAEVEKIRGGVLAAIRQLVDLIGKEGLERIEALGIPFDPSEHEAVMHDDAGDGEAAVVEVLRTGYRLKGRVIRPAMVKVGPAPG